MNALPKTFHTAVKNGVVCHRLDEPKQKQQDERTTQRRQPANINNSLPRPTIYLNTNTYYHHLYPTKPYQPCLQPKC